MSIHGPVSVLPDLRAPHRSASAACPESPSRCAPVRLRPPASSHGPEDDSRPRFGLSVRLQHAPPHYSNKGVGESKTEHPSRDVAEARPADTPPAAAASSRLPRRKRAAGARSGRCVRDVAGLTGTTLIRGRHRVELRSHRRSATGLHHRSGFFSSGSEVPLLEGSAVVGRRGQIDPAATVVLPPNLDLPGPCTGARVRPVLGRLVEEPVGPNPAERVGVLEVVADHAPAAPVHRVCVCLMVAANVWPTMLAGAIIVSGDGGLAGDPWPP